MKTFRRRPFRQAVSFFAFQDIITALAGSLLIIVLVSAWLKKNTSDAPPGTAGASYRSYRQLTDQIAQINRRINWQRSQLAELRSRQQQHTRQNQQQKLQHHHRFQLAELEKVINERQQLQQQLQQEIAQLEQAAAPIGEQQKKYLQLAAEVQRLRQELNDRQLRRKLSVAGRRTAILDCARYAWRWSDTPQVWQLLGQAHADRPPLPAVEGYRELRQKLQNTTPAIEQLVIAVRPSGGMFAEALKADLHQHFPKLKILMEPLFSENAGGLEL